MANKKHLEILTQGETEWNSWRIDNPEIRPDLERANLSDKDLSFRNLTGLYLPDVDLSRANLTGTRLNDAILTNANLSDAILENTILEGATLPGVNFHDINFNYGNLRRATLSDANLTNAKLIGADLSEAILNGANLTNANLSNADLTGARLYRVNFTDADLTDAKLPGANLADATLIRTNLTSTDLQRANLNEMDLTGAVLNNANLCGATLIRTNLSRANLTGTNLSRTKLCEADFSGANLTRANLSYAIMEGTNLTEAIFVETDFKGAKLNGCNIYGISAWGLKLEGTTQMNLTMTPSSEPKITVDNIEVAQFVYLMLHNEKIRDVINTIGKKGVLILGRFTPPDRKAVLEAIKEKLRKEDYVPIVFDFERPKDSDFTETIKTLAGMCRFIIADITKPSSTPLELQATVPDYMIPFVPIIQEGEEPFSMFRDLNKKYGWVLTTLKYTSEVDLIEVFKKSVIDPAQAMHDQLTVKKAEELPTRSTRDYM